MPSPAAPLRLLAPPYRHLPAVEDPTRPLKDVDDPRGVALVWSVGRPIDPRAFEGVRRRPGGVPLLVVLPPADEIDRPEEILRLVELSRPHSVLPHHEPDVGDLVSVLSRAPEDLPGDVGDYLKWRGVVLDTETRRIVRKIVELSGELRTVSALARSLYLSRRALGRRFMHRGLPVPSHWLQACRLLRSAIRLQSGNDNVFIVAAGLGYPDGFSLSNQMSRLIGVRPTRVRERLGWEWVLEAWLRKEATDGGFSKEWAPLFLGDGGMDEAPEAHPKGDGADSSSAEPASGAERQSARRKRAGAGTADR